MRSTFAALFLLIIQSSTAFGFATSTIWIPNNVTEDAGIFRFDSRVFFTLDKRPTDDDAQAPFVDEGVTFGIFNNRTVGAEAGFDWWEPETQDNLKCLHMHFKFSVLETDNFPGVTLGFYNFGFKANTTDENILYLGIAKTFYSAGRFFLGYSVGNGNVLVDEIGRPANQAFIASWEDNPVFPSLSRKMALLIDFQSSVSQEGAINFGLKWYLKPDVSLLLGYDIYNNRHLQRDTMTVQLLARL